MQENVKYFLISLLISSFIFFFAPNVFAVLSPNQPQDRMPGEIPSATFSPNRILVQYESPENPAENSLKILQEQEEIKKQIDQALKNSGFPETVRSRSVHAALISESIQKNKSISAVLLEKYHQKLLKKNLEPDSNTIQNIKVLSKRVVRKMILEFESLSLDISEIVRELNRPNFLGSGLQIKAFFDLEREAALIPNDPQFPLQWGLHNTGQTEGTPGADINAPEAWEAVQGESNVVVAVLDTGVDYNHSDLASNIYVNYGEDYNGNGFVDPFDMNGVDDDNNGYVDDVRGWDFVANTALNECSLDEDCEGRDNDPMDVMGHGTHVSGILGAATNNQIGIAGVSQSSIMPVRAGFKTPDGSGRFYDSDIESALLYTIQNGADVVNLSFGGFGVPPYGDVIQLANEMGIVLVAAAGNSSYHGAFYPAAFQSVIGVAATDHNDSRAVFANYGYYVDVAAPGINIQSTLPNNSYASWEGTSMAAPYAAGLSALVLSRHSQFNPIQVTNAIKSAADDNGIFGWDPLYGNGRIKADEAVQESNPFSGIVFVTSPLGDEVARGEIEIRGTVSASNFDHYTVSITDINSFQIQTQVCISSVAVQNGLLCSFDTLNFEDGYKIITVAVFDRAGRRSEERTSIYIDNIHPNFTEPLWSMIGEHFFGLLGGTVERLENSKFAFGEPGWLGGTGRVFVMDGNQILYTLPGEHQMSNFGSGIAKVNDVDGDGSMELLVGASTWNNGRGKVYLYSGSTGTLIRSWEAPTAEGNFGNLVEDVGDVNNDGFHDVALASSSGQIIYIYSATTGQLIREIALPNLRATNFASGGDFNGDGVTDLIVGMDIVGQTSSIRPGRVNIYSGATGSLIWTRSGRAGSYDRFGFSVAHTGDFNGDGFSDVLVGAYGYNGANGPVSGKAYILSGTNPNQELWSREGEHGANQFGFGGDGFGTACASGGDFNGDGISDFLVGAYYAFDGGEGVGKVYVYSGENGVLLKSFSGESSDHPTFFGLRAAIFMGDSNNDGRSEVLVGARQFSGIASGKVYVFAGRNNCIGDFNSDGLIDFDDFAIFLAAYYNNGDGDLNGDGETDFNDLTIFLSFFGNTCD